MAAPILKKKTCLNSSKMEIIRLVPWLPEQVYDQDHASDVR